jgi:hypothetical protein
VVERLVQAHDLKVEALEEAASSFIQDNALLFQVSLLHLTLALIMLCD